MTEARFAAATVLIASLAILGAALGFQYLGGLEPCALCHWQRYPYVATIVIGALAFGMSTVRPEPRRAIAALVALASALFLAGMGVSAFHVGVEQGWWEGLATCGAPRGPARDIEELRRMLLGQKVVRCDEIAWSLFGISMAGYNFLLSLALAGFAFIAAWNLLAAPSPR